MADGVAITEEYVLEQLSKSAEGKIVFSLGEIAAQNGDRSFLVGRSAKECDLCLDSPNYPCFTSRQHAKIDVIDGKVYVTDLKSVNGTFVNDVMLPPSVKKGVNVGDSLMFGCVSLDNTISPGSVVTQDNPVFKFILKKLEKTTVKKQFPKNEKAPKFEYLSIRNSDFDDGQSEPKESEDTILPLTVKNLIAFAGCNISVSEEEKENQSGDQNRNKNKTKTPRKRRRTLIYSKRKKRKPSHETCAFYDCKISKAGDESVISWVQCDDCDKWFHTECIGCDYNAVKSVQNKFQCGQC